MRWLVYNILFFVVYLLMTPKFLLRMRRRGGYGAHFGQRFGRYEEAWRRRLRQGGALWIHAVSVGEVYVAGQLMRALRALEPETRFVFSTTSSTGWREAEKQLGPRDVLIYNPLDFPGCVRRALDVIRPRACLLVETELWPNFVRQCHRRGIPLFLVNGRISDRSAPGYRILRYWFGPVLRCFSTIMAQSDLDAHRLLAAGADADTVEVTGSFKFDVAQRQPGQEKTAKALLTRLDLEDGRMLLMGASTWPGEEEVLLGIYRRLRARFPNLRLLLVPRHFERGNEVAARIEASGLHVFRKSLLDKGEVSIRPLAADDVMLLDTTGEIMGYYPRATVVFVGKSLCATGGQNMIEPCLCGCPTIVGPHTQNFRPVMSDLLAAGAILQVAGASELGEALERLLSTPAEREALGKRAAAAVAARRGVVERCARRLAKSLPAVL